MTTATTPSPATEASPKRHMDIRIETRSRTSDESATRPAPVIQMEDVSCWYGDFRAIRDISLDIRTNAITALIGPVAATPQIAPRISRSRFTTAVSPDRFPPAR